MRREILFYFLGPFPSGGGRGFPSLPFGGSGGRLPSCGGKGLPSLPFGAIGFDSFSIILQVPFQMFDTIIKHRNIDRNALFA